MNPVFDCQNDGRKEPMMEYICDECGHKRWKTIHKRREWKCRKCGNPVIIILKARTLGPSTLVLDERRRAANGG